MAAVENEEHTKLVCESNWQASIPVSAVRLGHHTRHTLIDVNTLSFLQWKACDGAVKCLIFGQRVIELKGKWA